MPSAPPGTAEFRMPSLGADMQFGTVVAWCVKPGDHVRQGDIVAEIETEKGVFETEIAIDGVVTQLLVPPMTKAPVGTVLALLSTDGTMPPAAAPAAAPAAVPAAPSPAAAEPSKPVVVTAPAPPPSPPVVAPRRVVPRASPAARRLAEHQGIDLASIEGSGPERAITLADVQRAIERVPPATPERPARVSPLARHIAEAEGLDLTTVTGTGSGGMITKTDVERLRTVPPLPSVSSIEDRTAAMRQAVAAAVARSKREIPHYYLGTDIDLQKALAWLSSENARRPVTERILPAVLLLKSVAIALRRFPALNGFWIDGAPRPSSAIHLGVAISLRGGGLIAPAIHSVERLTLTELMRALGDLVRRARSGGLRSSEMIDGTITISNLGDEGVGTLFGVIYPPQVALVGFGKITERPWAVNGLLGIRPVVTATLAADHRATDGHYGAQFLAAVDRLLQEPEAL
jgi:pyruvate dehydrogenase E2 component (dihydrolipoamide acetyltransferase)